jgi:hypothetical protein
MRSHVRISLLAVIAVATLGASVPAGAEAFGIEKFFAGNCGAEFEECGKGAEEPPEPSKKEKAEKEGFRQAAGFVPFGITDFKLKATPVGPLKGLVPEGNVENIRVDVAPGVVTNPEAVPKCPIKEFEGTPAGEGIFLAPKCPEASIIGKNIVVVAVSPEPGVVVNVPLEGKVYNLVQPEGLASDFGVALNLEPLFKAPVFSHTFIEGNVEWGTDYHDYFVIKNVSKTLPLVESRLVFFGDVGKVAPIEGKEIHREPTTFLRNPSVCSTPGPETTTTLKVDSYPEPTPTSPKLTSEKPEESPIGTVNCLAAPFGEYGGEGAVGPSFSLVPETALSDRPDGITPEVTVAHPPAPTRIDTSDLRTAVFTLPEGMTMNPSAARGLAACPAEQFKIGVPNVRTFAVPHLLRPVCPAGSQIGNVSLEVPTLPPGSLRGPIYLGTGAPNELITGPPYTIYFDAESKEFGVQVVLKGTVSPNPVTGQLTTTFAENPQAPFNNIKLHFNGGPLAPIANPVVCGPATMSQVYFAFSGWTWTHLESFTTGGCPTPVFAPSQSTAVSPTTAGAQTSFTFSLTRPEGQQYVGQLRTVLPAGLVGKIPSVPLCPEAQANAGTCPSTSLIGSVAVTVGSGEPYPFTGNAYLTGPYQGAPYGLSFVVPVAAGPFNLGTEVTRARIEVEPESGRVVVATRLPTIRGGIPIRLRSLTVNINRPNYLLNPTNCEVLKTESTATSTVGATALVSSPFQVTGCSSLAFKPSFKATSSARTSKANGASLETTINQPSGQANIKSVLVQLPAQLPSRLTTLQKACLAATFDKNPASCPAGSFVGGARANTPVLPGKLQGPAMLVSHGGEAFPDLDLVLEANGVRVILVGHTRITKAITTTNFSTTPDVPVSSVTVNLPTGPHSALTANGNLCPNPLIMPTTITGQNGKQIKQNTRINVTNCPVEIVGSRVVGNNAVLTVRTYEAGRISGSGSGLDTVVRHLNGATRNASLTVPLSNEGLSRGRPFSVRVRVGFVPKRSGVSNSIAYTNVTFR